MKVRAGMVLILATMAVFAAPITAVALCAAAPGNPLSDTDQSEVIFVGTAVELDGWVNALFRVDEVWKGGPLPEWQAIRGELREDSPEWQEGKRFLVEAHHESFSFDLWTRQCENSQPYGQTAASYRPTNVQAPTTAARPVMWQGAYVDSRIGFLLLVGLAATVVGSFYLVTRRRRTA